MMEVSRQDLDASVEAGILQPDQVEPLINFLEQREFEPLDEQARFTGTHILYYLGGMMAITAISLFTTLAIEAVGMTALLVLAVIYGICAIGVAVWFESRGLGIPAGIFAALAIALTPLAVFALQHVLGFWTDGGHAQHYRDFHRWIDWRWVLMELSTLLVGVLMLKRFRYPFLVMPVAVTLWYLGMDIIPALIMGSDAETGWYSGAAWELRKNITLVFGLIMLLGAFFVDLRSRFSKDYAFWLYLFGLMTFWGALSSMGSGALAGKLFYLAINLLLIFIGAVLVRRTFAVFGGMGTMVVLTDLSWRMFSNSFLFVLILSLLGFALIALGVWWNKHEAELSQKMRAVLPNDLRELIEARAATR